MAINMIIERLSWSLECQNFLQHCSSCLSCLRNYFDSTTKFIFRSVSSQIFRCFSKTILSVQLNKMSTKCLILSQVSILIWTKMLDLASSLKNDSSTNESNSLVGASRLLYPFFSFAKCERGR